MTRKFSVVLALSALVLTAGCKKSINSSSVNLAKGAKAVFASNPDWQTPNPGGRLIRFDINDGKGSDCILAYDVNTNEVSLTQINGSGSTNLWSSPGLWLDNHVIINVNGNTVTDNFAEFGGIHIIPYDANGTGHEDHLLVYLPGSGNIWLLSYDGGGYWRQDWFSNGAGIAGYDLKGATLTDKIIAYDYGSGYKNALICYRPGNQYFWVIENTGTDTSPNWVAVVKSSGGVGGYDLKGTYDQLVAIPTGTPGYMDLVCYRPGTEFVWWETHNPYNTSWTTVASSRSGLNGNTFSAYGDRMIAVNISLSGATGENADTYMFGYRPGYGLSYSYNYQYVPAYNFVETWNLFGGLNYPMNKLPYSPNTYIGDHTLNFSPNGQGNSSLLFYSNGGGNQSQLYEWGPGSYNQVY